ncbi:hypothetical protein VTK73DRAFT_9202 [Phialemonium thermophilum]|uniref:Zn(2)-C6 fungal-type domain-containing protein n=1 Tax=Phialemonium thermophilum TaxID=223376 RepID=A0ABR3XM70_9PEZI
MTTAVKRACDACHRRKVKCDGINPCRNCSASQLTCTYNAIPQKKGPKGSRAKVISELRETQRQTSLTTKVQNRLNGVSSPPPSNASLVPTPGLLTPEIVKHCIEFFFANMYSTMPILHRQRLEQQSLYMDQSLDTYCLLTSLCAFTMLQPGMTLPGTDPYSPDTMLGANIISGTLLMDETLRVRKGYDYQESSSLNSLCTSYFLFGCYYGLDMHDKAWFHLREATTLLHMLGMNREEAYGQFDSIEAARRRRLYWLFFVTERAYALQRQRPLTLQATINLPSLSDDPSDPLGHQLNGFLLLASMFRPFDDAFIALWNRARGECSPSYVSTMQKQLQEVLPSYLNSQDAQLAELQVDQHWLKNMQWQLSMATGNAAELYSIDIGRDLLPMVSHFPGSLGLLGLGLLEKLFEISSVLAEILSMQPASRDPFSLGPREYLHQLLNVVSVIRGGDQRFLPLLLSKAHEILPRLANPMLQNAPENGCNIDIFDGFGNAGMAQPPMFQTEDYDGNFGMARMDELSNDSGSPSGGVPSAKNDINSPFVSSPGIMSPGIDVPHGMQGDFNSMPDIVMNTLPSGTRQLNTPGPMSGQHTQHQQRGHQHQPQQHEHQPQHHHPHSVPPPYQNLTPQIGASQSLNGQNSNQSIALGQSFGSGVTNTMSGRLGNSMSQTMNNNSMLPQQQPQRANSFAIGPHQIRTVGDFHALQRASSDMNPISAIGVPNIRSDLDFNTLSR